MAIPPNINASHVREAMQRIVENGIPADAESTKYDVVGPNEERLPPKLVVSTAAEIATGQPFPRSSFSGGEAANRVLRTLGFSVVVKSGRADRQLTPATVAPGMVLSNDEVSTAFGVGNAGGMRWSSANNLLVIITDHTKALYDDRWDEDILHYTGMGRIGDQTLTGQNLRLAEQRVRGVDVHLCEVFQKNEYQYKGRVELAGEVYTESQPGDDGVNRRVYIFPLRIVNGEAISLPTEKDIATVAGQRRRSLRKLSLSKLVQAAIGSQQEKPGVRHAVSIQYQRSEAVALLVKHLANGVCDLCQQDAPFQTGEGPYLECHHIVRLADSGPDTLENTVALCPNCHRKMHALNRNEDRTRLARRIARRLTDIESISAI